VHGPSERLFFTASQRPARGSTRNSRSTTWSVRWSGCTGSWRIRSVDRYFLLSSRRSSPPPVVAQRLGGEQGAEQVGAAGDAHRQAQFRRKALHHADRIAVVDRDHRIEFAQSADRRDELVGNTLDGMPADLAAGGQGGRIGRFQRVHADGGAVFAQEGARAHDDVVGAHDRDEGLRYAADGGQLGEDLGAGAGAVRGDIVVVVELAWQEGAGMSLRELLGQRDAAEEAPSSRLTRRTVAPRLRIRSLRSWLIQSGMKIVTGWPCARPMAAKAMPVLPLGGLPRSARRGRAPSARAHRRGCAAPCGPRCCRCSSGTRLWRRPCARGRGTPRDGDHRRVADQMAQGLEAAAGLDVGDGAGRVGGHGRRGTAGNRRLCAARRAGVALASGTLAGAGQSLYKYTVCRRPMT
jgi:hypothetical protein